MECSQNQDYQLNPTVFNIVNNDLRPASISGFQGVVLRKPRTSVTLWVLGVLILPLALLGAEPRGIWWYSASGNSWGAEQVLGNNAKEAAVIQFLQEWNIGRVYCGFNAHIRTNFPLIRTWNTKLHAAGKSSQLLLGEDAWIFPQHRSKLLTLYIQRDLIDFNAAATKADQRYDGLHLDIEPHGLPEWKTSSPAGRKDFLLLLRDTFQQVRLYLNQHGASAIPVYADLPVWYDQLPTPVGWNSAAERDAWFADLAKSLAGISLMAYDRKTSSAIEKGVDWELQNFKGEVRVGLKASVGAGKTWNSLADFVAIIQAQEAAKPSRHVDVFDFDQFHAVADPVSATSKP